uniref:TMEM131_like domain-containing protein n=1 Tax=Rhabditophanes sp. KR3021 TaxID=114890 RepID=A0AC35TUB3_9BILA
MLRNIILNTLKRLFIASLLLLCAYTNLVLTKEITQKSPSELSENVDDAISHAFIQTGSEIYYLVDDEAVWASVNDLNEEYSLNINPRDLNFGESFIGVPNKMTVNIFNPTEKIFKFEKIAGSSSHFHASFPKKTELKPNEATTFDVYFLARSEKLIEGIITVKSNKGIIKLGVKGEGLRSPYRLRSNIMAILPMNGTFTAPINLHNPHSKILKVTEIISSSNDLQLELPNGRIIQDIAPDSWEIEPLQTKTLLMAKVLGSKEQNTLAFITLKATLIERNKKGVLKDRFSESFAENVPNRLILPVNINVEEKKALYATTDVFDFGYIKAGLKSKIEKILNVFSTLAKSVDVESVYYEPNDKKHSMHIGYPSNSQRSISPSLDNKPGSTVPVAAISMNSVAYNDYVTGNYKEPNSGETFVSGKIILLTKGGLHNVSVPYIGRIYTG